MEKNLDEIKEAWKQDIDSSVIKAATEDWGGYPPHVQAIIEAEAKKRGLWEKVIYLRGETIKEPVSKEGNLEGYVCDSCKGTYLNFETGRCVKCDLPPDSMGYCIECDKFWSLPPGKMCPEHGTKLSRHKAAMAMLRLGNDIFDRVLIFPIAFAIVIVAVALGFVKADYFENIDSASDYALSFGLFLLYYFVFEIVWQRTLGKFITGTKVITADGKEPTLGAIAIRTLVRFVPFEAFSFLGERVRGWHDKWSGTYVIKAKRFERKKVGHQVASVSPKGIGGWLVLVAIGIVLSPILISKDLGLSILPAYKPDTWNILTSPGSERYIPYFAHLLVFETLACIFLLIYSFLLLFYFFGKKKALPKLLIIFLCLRLATYLVDEVGVYLIFPDKPLDAGSIGEFVGGLIRFLGSCSIWIPYFLKSKRVRNTFVLDAKTSSQSQFINTQDNLSFLQTHPYKSSDAKKMSLAATLSETELEQEQKLPEVGQDGTAVQIEEANKLDTHPEVSPTRLGRLEKCANCDGIIGKLESSYNFKENVICSRCYHKLKQE